MPVPKNRQKEYSTIVAAQTARLERAGLSPSEANKLAKAMADEHISKPAKRKKK